MSTPDNRPAEPVQIDPAAPLSGKRLSPLRVTIAIVGVLVIAAGTFFGIRMFDSSASADTASPWFAGYVDATVTPAYAFEAPANAAGKDVVLSFIVASGSAPCTPSWGAAYTLDQAAQSLDLDRRIARLQQQGGNALVSFGGAANQELATACTDPTALESAYQAVVDRYSLSTIDLDIEGDNLTDPAVGQRRADAIAALQQKQRAAGKDLAVWLTLPVTPTGLATEGTDAVAQMLKAGVDVAGVNVMTMDYGSSLPAGESMGQAAIDALNATHGQLDALYSDAGIHQNSKTLWSKLGATPMIGQNDTPGEVFSIADAQTLSAFAQAQGLGRMSMWSLNRDITCGPNYVDLKTVSNACSGVDQGTDSFATILATGFGGSPDAAASATTTPDAPSTPIADNPATSPYPIWSNTSSYLQGTKIVWHGNVYQAKWWTRGDIPDNPVLSSSQTPWTLIGPVLPGEKPYSQPTLPAGTYPEWDGAAVYNAGDRVLFQGTPYTAKWWNQASSPAAASSDPDGSPWVALTQQQVDDVLNGKAGS
jgi:chitinase